MGAILMTVESVRTRATTSEALLTLAVPLEQGALISNFLSRIGQKVGVAFADLEGKPLTGGDPDDATGGPAGALGAESSSSLPARHQSGNNTWSQLGPLCQSAIQLCEDERFHGFVAREWELEPEAVGSEEASDYIKGFCGIESRKELDNDDRAAKLFANLMQRYREFLSESA